MYNSQQRQALEHRGHALVVACPGSGKTHLLVGKVAAVLDDDPTSSICVVTFTRDAADGVKARIRKAIGTTRVRKCVTGTFHSLAMRQLRTAGLLGNLASPGVQNEYLYRTLAAIMDDPEALAFYRDGEDSEPLNVARISNEIESIKTSDEFIHGILPDRSQAPAFFIYQSLLQRSNKIDFTDLMVDAVKHMRSGRLQPIPVAHMFIDEFQDTDHVQYCWAMEHVNAGTKVMVVGDDDQTIFEFRHALGYDGMLSFQRHTQAEQIVLPVNYRCHREILDAADCLIRRNSARVPKQLHAKRGPGGHVTTYTAGNLDDVAKQLLAAMDDDLVPLEDGPTGYTHSLPAGRWAVLARTNQILLNFSRALFSAPKRVRIWGSAGSSIWDSEPMLSYTGTLESIETRSASGLDQALAWAGMDHASLSKLHELFGKHFTSRVLAGGPHFPYSKLSSDSAALLRELHETSPCSEWERLVSEGLYECVASAVATWMKRILAKRLADDDKKAVRLQAEILDRGAKLLGALKGPFSKRIALVRKPRDNSAEENSAFPGLGLLTMHASKGLEFDNVWIVGANDTVTPGQSCSTDSEIEAERRLFYVAMTRAKNNLTIAWTTAEGKPSRFVEEAGLLARR